MLLEAMKARNIDGISIIIKTPSYWYFPMYLKA